MPYRLSWYTLFYIATRPATAGSSIGNSSPTIWPNIDFVRPRSSVHVAGFSNSRNNSIIHPSTLWRHINRRRMRMMMCCPQPQQEQQQVVMDTSSFPKAATTEGHSTCRQQKMVHPRHTTRTTHPQFSATIVVWSRSVGTQNNCTLSFPKPGMIRETLPS